MRLKRILLFIWPMLFLFKINIVGELPLSEIMAIVCFPFCFNCAQKNSFLKNVCLLFLYFFVSLVISDLFNQSDWRNFLRGWASAVVLIISTVFVYSIMPRAGDIKSYFSGLFLAQAVSNGMGFSVDVSNPGSDKYWWHRIGVPISSLLCRLCCVSPARLSPARLQWILFGAGVFFIGLNGRSDGAIWVLTAVIYFYFARVKAFLRWWVLAKRILLLLPFVYLIYAGYVYVVINHVIPGGERSYEQLVRCENPYNPLEYLKAGRGELWCGLLAISDRPLLGFGSWGVDPDNRYLRQMLSDRKMLEPTLNVEGVISLRQKANRNYIPCHSVFLGAWVWGGLLAGFAWIALYFVVIRKCFVLLQFESAVRPLLIFIVIRLSWDFMFSPLTGTRVYLPVFVAFLARLSEELESPPKAASVEINGTMEK